jgi:hypothetical protein
MYQIKDRHIDFILNDISARGVTIEDLQYNLLDHVCCIIENNLEENGDFEHFYQKTVQSFFKNELKEIEDETISLIIFKNYYTMKKAMIISGAVSASFFTTGLIFKFLHWPGAGIMLILGIGILSLVFLPLMFLLKVKEKQSTKDKVTIGLGTLSGILISMGILFKVMHWPGANIMMQGSIAVMLLLFLPFYFFTGIRNPDTKVNTIVSSIILLSACGLLFTLMRSPKGTQIRDQQFTANFLRNEKLLQAEWALLKEKQSDSLSKGLNAEAEKVLQMCENIKQHIVKEQTNGLEIHQLKNEGASIGDHSFSDIFNNTKVGNESKDLKKVIEAYNEKANSKVDYSGMFFDESDAHYISNINILMALEQIIQVERMVLQNERALVASK